MQIEHHDYYLPALTCIVRVCDPHVQLCFLQFLQPEIIMQIEMLGRKFKREECFYRLATVLNYFKRYLNRVDRSMYYMFYEEKSFLPLEETLIINIAEQQYSCFFQLTNECESAISRLYHQTQFIDQHQQLHDLFSTLFFQTDYPLPVCKRQTIGVYCDSPFQHFLSCIRFPLIQHVDDYIQPPLEEMRRYFLQDVDMEKMVGDVVNSQQGLEVRARMNMVRYCPYVVGDWDVGQLLVDDFPLHNIIVMLFRLAATNARASYLVVKSHVDPIMRMAEFVTRASIFKNLILSIQVSFYQYRSQEKFGFLFTAYQDVFDVVSKEEHNHKYIPKFQFWNGALTIWVRQFEEINEQLYESFNYILLKERQTNAINFLTEKSQMLPSIYNTVKLQLEEKSIYDNKKEQLYKGVGVSYEEFFQQSIDSYEILAKDFLQHEIDISINQDNVHKCGHSQHVIKRIPFFNNFIDSIKENTKLFYTHLQKAVFEKHSDKKLRISILKDLIKFDLDFLDGKFVKPVILRQILSYGKSLIESLVKKLPQFAIFTQEGLQKFNLSLDFSHRDNLLDYFSSKSQIPDDCNQKYRCFYDCYKDKSVEEMIALALSDKAGVEEIESEIEEECYESSLSNVSIGSVDLEL